MFTKIGLYLDLLKKKPKQLFLLDGLGAFLTAFFLAIVLTRFQEYFGMPQRTLYFLSIIACFYGIYSISCYFLNTDNWLSLLKIIAIANLTYCFITIGLVYYFYRDLTILGLLYFVLELIIIFGLIAIEFIVINPKPNT